MHQIFGITNKLELSNLVVNYQAKNPEWEIAKVSCDLSLSKFAKIKNYITRSIPFYIPGTQDIL